LHIITDRLLVTVGGGDSCRPSPVDWSLVTDTELNKPEVLAMQAEIWPDTGAFRATLERIS